MLGSIVLYTCINIKTYVSCYYQNIEVYMIIDFHCHLGNILIENGGKIASQKNLRKRHPFDPDYLSRLFLYNSKFLKYAVDKTFLLRFVSYAERRRCKMASAENLIHYMDKNNIEKTGLMPIAPNVTFDDIYDVCKQNDRLIAFGCVDFRKDIIKQVQRQQKLGAKGFKIHPILQKVKADSNKMHTMMNACKDNTIILAHTGYSNYYPKKQSDKQKIEYGDIYSFANLCKAHSNLRFVAAHAGLREIDDVIKHLSPLQNVWVDTSFQSPDNIKELISSFGEDKVLFASDWPYGFQKTAIDCVKNATKDNKILENKILYDNAVNLLA
jgi:uncharacterized protein